MKELILFFSPWINPLLLIRLPQHLVFEIWIRMYRFSGPMCDFSKWSHLLSKQLTENPSILVFMHL